MADKKLSSVSAVSDMNYVYAETSSGETVKISKADLASVVAGLLPQLLQYWFQPKRTISSYADANTLTETGIYRLAWESGGSSNFPLNINIYCYGFLLVFAMDSENFVQVVINESNQICVRQLFDKIYWRPWVEVV